MIKLRNLGGIIVGDQTKSDMFLDKGGNIVADIENEPDRDKTSDAVEIDLQEIANDVAIEESHEIFEFRFAIRRLQ